MIEYDSSTAIHFIAFAVLFTAAFAFVTWRIVRNLEQEDEAAQKTVPEDADDTADDQHESREP